MKLKIVIVILVLGCFGLGIALYTVTKQADDQRKNDADHILQFSNELVQANENLEELRQVNLTLTNDISLSQQETEQLSNSLVSANVSLMTTKTSLMDAQGQITNLNSQIGDLTTHISDLETQNKILDQRANDLTNTIAQLAAQIADTQNQLAVSETNGAYLQGELQKQLAQRAELEHKFNDLNEVRAQVHKLRDEIFVARRLQLMKNDNSSKKGAELLMQRSSPTNSARLPANYDLNVEIGSDGSVRVIPPMGATNAPATTNAP
jgi:chromosome segregation ATPase